MSGGTRSRSTTSALTASTAALARDFAPAAYSVGGQQRPRRLSARTSNLLSFEFHPSHGDMLRLLRSNGFEVLDLIEIAIPSDAVDHPFFDFVPAAWATLWPAEEIWVARKSPQ